MPAIDKRKAVQAAIEYTRQRRFDKAIAEYQSALKADPQDLTIYKKLGDLYAQTGAVQEAITTYLKLGDLYRADNLAVKAIAIYKMVLNLDPRNMQIYLACADLYAEQGLIGEAKIQYMTVAEHYTRARETAKALEVLEKIASLDPTNFAAAAKVGELCEKERLPDKAVTNYVMAAQAAARAGQITEAHQLYGRALRIRPDAFEAQFGVGKLYFESGAYAEAAPALEQAAGAAPGSPAPLFLLGQCHRKLGSPARAQEALRRAVEADPAATEARLELARCLMESGDAEPAHEEFVKAADQLLEEGRGEEALTLLQDVCAGDPQATGPLAKLAEIARRLGREDEAQEVERRLAALGDQRGAAGEAAQEQPSSLARLVGLDELGEEEGLETAGPAGMGEGWRSFEGLLPEEEGPRVIPITESLEGAGDDVGVLGQEGPGIGLLPDDTAEAPPGIEVTEDAAEVAEQLAEADVYLKYGLIEKAVERLRETLSEVPQNLAARARLRKLFMDEGRVSEAVTEGLALADALAGRAEGDRAVQELMALQRVDPENREIQERLLRLREGAQETGPPSWPRVPPAEPGLAPESPPPDVPSRPAAPLPHAGATAAEERGAPAQPLEGAPGWLDSQAPGAADPGPVPFAAPVALDGAEEGEAWAGLLAMPPGGAEPAAGPLSEGEEGVLDLSNLLRLSEGEGGQLEPAPDAAAALQQDLGGVAGPEAEASPHLELEEPERGSEPVFTLSLGGPQEELEEADFYRAQGMFPEAAALYRRVLAAEPGNEAALVGLAALGSGSVVPGAPHAGAPTTEDTASDVPSGEEALAGDTWITGPDPFPLEAVTELDLSPQPPPEASAAEGAGLTPAAFDLSAAEPLALSPAPPEMEEALPEWPVGPAPEATRREEQSEWESPAGAPGPASAVPSAGLATAGETPWSGILPSVGPPVEQARSLSALDAPRPGPSVHPQLEPEQPPEASSAPPAAPPAPPEASATPTAGAGPAPSVGARRIGPAEEIPIFRVAAPTDAREAGDFVDLGAEIQREMDVPAEGAALLDALLGEFQRGVRENLDADDYETHYNLGIAYKEMDLFEEAIEEFRLAAKDPTRRVTCSGLMALCLLRRGQAPQAITELTRTLELPGLAPEERHALEYDLASAHEAAGQEDRALELLEALADRAPFFRDAAALAAALRERLRRSPPAEAARTPAQQPAPRRPETGGPGRGSTQPPAGPLPPAPGEAGKAQEPPPGPPTTTPIRPRRNKISFV